MWVQTFALFAVAELQLVTRRATAIAIVPVASAVVVQVIAPTVAKEFLDATMASPRATCLHL